MTRNYIEYECPDCRRVSQFLVGNPLICSDCDESTGGQTVVTETIPPSVKEEAINDLLADLPGDLKYKDKKG